MRKSVYWLSFCIFLGFLPAHASAQGSGTSSTCANGTAFRNAYHGDPVCVPYAERKQVADDNAMANSRISPGPYGPRQCKNGFKWRLARPEDLVCVTVDEFNLVQQQNRLASSRLAINGGVDVSSIPEAARPGEHTLILRPSVSAIHNSTYSHKGYVFGIFINADLDCEHTHSVVFPAPGSGANLSLAAGWGQVMGTGMPGGGKDPCFSWVTQAAVDFDFSPYNSIPASKTLTLADLSYHEAEASVCASVTYTQGGVARFVLPCYSNGTGAREIKRDSCVILSIPSDDWEGHPPRTPLQTLPGQYPRMGSAAWNVTTLVDYRINPLHQPLNYNRALLGHGFMLVGTPILAKRLEARDNTRCASSLTDIKLILRYTVPPIHTGPPPTLPK